MEPRPRPGAHLQRARAGGPGQLRARVQGLERHAQGAGVVQCEGHAGHEEEERGEAAHALAESNAIVSGFWDVYLYKSTQNDPLVTHSFQLPKDQQKFT